MPVVNGGSCGAPMRAIDTNVLVRLIVRDDPEQVARAEAFVEPWSTIGSPCRMRTSSDERTRRSQARERSDSPIAWSSRSPARRDTFRWARSTGRCRASTAPVACDTDASGRLPWQV